MSVFEDFSALYTALTGKDADERLREAVKEAQQLSGLDDFPEHLCVVARILSSGTTRERSAVPRLLHGFAWLLSGLAEALPGAEYSETDTEDRLEVESLGLVAVLTRGVEQFYSIEPMAKTAEGPPPAPPLPEFLGGFDPNEADVRTWAYDLSLCLTPQDEHLAIARPRLVPLMIELAADPACPRRTMLLGTCDDLVAAPAGPYDHELLSRARDLAASHEHPELQAWAADLRTLEAYLLGSGPVDETQAKEMFRILIVGRRGLPLLERKDQGPWYVFELRMDTPSRHLLGQLYMHRETGALAFARRSLTLEELAPYTHPVRREDPLAQRFRI